MTVWTITPGALHDEAPGLWFGVNGDDHGQGDPHHERHYATMGSALNFLFGHKMKIGDSLVVVGKDRGNDHNLELVKNGAQYVHDVDGQQFSGVDELIDYLDDALQPGDVLKYHH